MEREILSLLQALINSFNQQTIALKEVQERLSVIENLLVETRKNNAPAPSQTTLQNTKAYNHLSNLGIAGNFSEFGL